MSPSWCNNEASGGHGGAFPTDLEDVTLSSPTTSTLKNSGFEGGAAGGTNQSSSCSPPSGVTDLTPLNPQDHFDPDFDVVDDIKFIDSLIRTMPEDQQHNDGHYSGKRYRNLHNWVSLPALHDKCDFAAIIMAWNRDSSTSSSKT